MMSLMQKNCQSEDRVRHLAEVARIHGQVRSVHPGTCFAGKGKVCAKTLTPNTKKAARLRTQKYW